jgi:hypothetical protein
MIEAFSVKRVLGPPLFCCLEENRDEQRNVFLYETISNQDFFVTGDVSGFDWDKYFKKAFELTVFYDLINECELATKSVHSEGQTYIYNVETASNKQFSLVVEFCHHVKIKQLNLPDEVAQSFGEEDFMCLIEFKDTERLPIDVKEFGLLSFEVFSAAKLCFLSSLADGFINFMEHLKGVSLSSTKDKQMLFFYEKLITKTLPDFKNIFLDELSDKEFVNLIVTK